MNKRLARVIADSGTAIAHLPLTSREPKGMCLMVKLNSGNVLLKPSNRRQLMSCLKRAQRLGSQVGDFLLTITFQRTGNLTEVRADVHDAAGNFTCRVRRHEWKDAMREIVHMLASRLNAQRLGLAMD